MLGKVLLLIEKYHSANPKWGLSNLGWAEFLADSGLAERIELFHYDMLSQQYGLAAMGELLLERCGMEPPDLIISTGGAWFDLRPPRFIMNIITSKLGMKVLMICGDSVTEKEHRWINSWFPFVNFVIFIDATLGHLGYRQHPKAIQGFVPHTNRFYDKKLERDIDVSFVGSIADWPRRAEYIEFLRQHGVKIVTSGGALPNRISQEEYSAIISRSKISLNFCLHHGGFLQLKARVFEVTACRTLLLEDEGTETREFFEEGKDFIMISSKEEMLEKVNYYLEHDEERERIATCGYRKTTTLYNVRNFWGYALSKMGLAIPDGLAQDRHYQQLYHKLESLSK